VPSAALPSHASARDARNLRAPRRLSRRPAGGRAALSFADATGELAEVALAGAERRVHRARDGVLASAADPAAIAELEKACAAAGALAPERFAALLGGAAVVLDPAACALELDGVRYSAAPGA
jgi:hypothetical protein